MMRERIQKMIDSSIKTYRTVQHIPSFPNDRPKSLQSFSDLRKTTARENNTIQSVFFSNTAVLLVPKVARLLCRILVVAQAKAART